MRPVGAFLLAAATALLLRSTALSSLATRGIFVDVLAFATVVWALRHGDAWGSSFGFLLGLVADLDAAHFLGRHALALSLLGYAVGRLAGTLVRESARTQFVLLATATLLHQGWGAAFELGGGVVGVPFLLVRALVSTAVTASSGTLLLMALRRLAGRPLFGDASGATATN